MNDYIRKAVELADGWKLASRPTHWRGHGQVSWTTRPMMRHELDALAAQLRLQAHSNPHIVFNISVVDSASFVEMIIYNPNGDEEAQPLRFVANEMEESTACIKVIVDSKVLK